MKLIRQYLTWTARRFYSQPTPRSHPYLLSTEEVTPRITKTEYRQRRERLCQLIASQDEAKRHVIVIPSLDRSYMAAGVPFIHRQHSDMIYLSGFLEDESALVMEINKGRTRSTLFVKVHTAHQELWEGKRAGTAGSVELTGIENAETVHRLGSYLRSITQDPNVMLWYNYITPVSRNLHQNHLSNTVKDVNPANIRSAENHIHELRVLKSPAERELMRVCGTITEEMFIESIPSTREQPDEHALFAKLDYECRIRGASNLAYLPVVAGGENALVIHYIENNCRIPADALVLVDAGCDFHGYVSDVTRTWPVSGQFTEVQRQVYEALEEVHKACLSFCRPHEYSLNEIHNVMIALIGQQIRRLGVVSPSASDGEVARMAQRVCPHHVGHYLGLDVHDTPSVSRSRKLEPHMTICIEPGMYFRSDTALKELRGLGARIEDNVLLTDSGYENLTAECPISTSDIEDLFDE